MGENHSVRKDWDRILADLFVKHEKVAGQITATQSAVDRETLKNQLKDIEQEIAEAEEHLASLDAKTTNPRKREAKVKRDLHKINFTEAVNCVKNTLQSFGSKGGAALFLLEKSYEMAGECCVGRIRELLEEETHPDRFREYPVDFSVEMQLNEYGLLQRLGEHVGIELDGADLIGCAQAIIQKLCAPLQNGSVVFLVFSQWDMLQDAQERVLRQFIDLFWHPLVNRFPLEQKRRIKLVSIITAEGALAPSCYTLQWSCSQAAFTVGKIQPLKLRPWTYEEIQTWVDMYSGTGWEARQIDLFARHLYNSYKGSPRFIYDKLSKKFASVQEV